MRHSLALLILLTFFIFGCAENSSLVNPVTDSNNLEWISLQSNSLSKSSLAEEKLLFTKSIHPEKGGTIDIKVKGDISIKGKLKVPKNSFKGGKQDFKIQLSSDLFVIDFEPSDLDFNPNLKFSIVYKGVDLDGIDEDKIKFVYINEDKEIEPVEYDELIIDVKKGILGVKNAKIRHFSRYAYIQ